MGKQFSTSSTGSMTIELTPMGVPAQTPADRRQWDSLAEVPSGMSVVLAAPQAEAGLCRRLAQLGLRPGMRVTVAQKTAGGGRVVKSGTSRYAIDRETLALMGVLQ